MTNTEGRIANKAEDLEIVIGGRDLREANGNPWVVHVDKFFTHPQWNSQPLQNDIALIKTKESLMVNQGGYQSKAATLPLPNQDFAGKTASGYGVTENGQTSPTAKLVDLTIYDKNRCRRSNGNFEGNMFLCAGSSSSRNNGICGGDSGGPLVVRQNGRNTVIGVSSFVIAKCGQSGVPGFFSRVSNYIPWILNTVLNN